MTESPEKPLFECPLCQSQVQQQNAAKHLLNKHQDTKTLHKYVSCPVCEGLFIKHKLTPHVRKAHGTQAVPSYKARKRLVK